MATNNEDNLAKFRQSMVWNERSSKIFASFDSKIYIPFHPRLSYFASSKPFRYFPTRNSTPSIVFQLPANVDSSPTWNNNWFESFQAYIYTPSSLPRVAKNQFQTARPIAGIERTTAKLGNDAPNDQLAKMFGQFRGAIRLWNETISLHLGIWHDNGEWPSLEQ